MGNMVRHRTIMQRSTEEIFEGMVLFEQEPDEEGQYEQILITKQNWEDFGEPEVITISVEPGDRLNDEGVVSLDDSQMEIVFTPEGS